jgi:glycosyltransferase involved in cell wall biosynthesis
LKVFPSLQVYQDIQEADDEFAWLYERCRETEGVDYFGSVPQPQLANEMRPVSLLTYPNTFAETSCISVMEAMACGCHIVTSMFGALPETTAGFASLVPLGNSREGYMERFTKETIRILRGYDSNLNPRAESRLREQVDHINTVSSWPAIAKQWLDWFQVVSDT